MAQMTCALVSVSKILVDPSFSKPWAPKSGILFTPEALAGSGLVAGWKSAIIYASLIYGATFGLKRRAGVERSRPLSRPPRWRLGVESWLATIGGMEWEVKLTYY